MEKYRGLSSVARKRKSSTLLLPTDSTLGNNKDETKPPCGTLAFERSCEDSSGEKRRLQQILKQAMADQLLPFFRRSPSRANEGAVWPGHITWVYYGKEKIPEETWICRLRSVQESTSHLLCKQRQVNLIMFLKLLTHLENLSSLHKMGQHFSKSSLPQFLLACK